MSSFTFCLCFKQVCFISRAGKPKINQSIYHSDGIFYDTFKYIFIFNLQLLIFRYFYLDRLVEKAVLMASNTSYKVGGYHNFHFWQKRQPWNSFFYIVNMWGQRTKIMSLKVNSRLICIIMTAILDFLGVSVTSIILQRDWNFCSVFSTKSFIYVWNLTLDSRKFKFNPKTEKKFTICSVSVIFFSKIEENLGFRLAYFKNRGQIWKNGYLASNNFQQSTFSPNLSPVAWTEVKNNGCNRSKNTFKENAP